MPEARISIVYNNCSLHYLNSSQPCPRCKSRSQTCIVDWSPPTLKEIHTLMLCAPLPIPMSMIFIQPPFKYLSLEQLRIIHECFKRGQQIYVLGK